MPQRSSTAEIEKARKALQRLSEGDSQKRKQLSAAVKATLALRQGEPLARLVEDVASVLSEHLERAVSVGGAPEARAL